MPRWARIEEELSWLACNAVSANAHKCRAKNEDGSGNPHGEFRVFQILEAFVEVDVDPGQIQRLQLSQFIKKFEFVIRATFEFVSNLYDSWIREIDS